jgi:coenzyme F420-reducing hydrogenase alpha subunit
MTLVGGREIHPINVRVGGWYRVPRKRELAPLRERLERARELALETTRLTATLDFPEYTQDYELVALAAPDEYPIDRGRIVSNRGLDIVVDEYDEHFVEEHVPWSNALHSSLRDRGSYLCGPLARFALSHDRLSPVAREAAAEAGLSPDERNPFRSIVVRSVELVYAADEALRLVDAYEEPDAPALEVEPRAGTGYGCTEAPRGILYHRYRLDDDGTILDAKIVPPTSQNQRVIEEDLRGVVERSLHVPDGELSLLCEQTIRNYDPCISCATHFLNLQIERR